MTLTILGSASYISYGNVLGKRHLSFSKVCFHHRLKALEGSHPSVSVELGHHWDRIVNHWNVQELVHLVDLDQDHDDDDDNGVVAVDSGLN